MKRLGGGRPGGIKQRLCEITMALNEEVHVLLHDLIHGIPFWIVSAISTWNSYKYPSVHSNTNDLTLYERSLPPPTRDAASTMLWKTLTRERGGPTPPTDGRRIRETSHDALCHSSWSRSAPRGSR
eukprot:gb/GECG01001555.1/.p1 GENE.gb/GECG01001555.1/~~gb/GECG01001555.1/.p1  ORF type:complete len:126 (+),score=4.53 gb/GECG01001555.1/:1-378(+)